MFFRQPLADLHHRRFYPPVRQNRPAPFTGGLRDVSPAYPESGDKPHPGIRFFCAYLNRFRSVRDAPSPESLRDVLAAAVRFS